MPLYELRAFVRVHAQDERQAQEVASRWAACVEANEAFDPYAVESVSIDDGEAAQVEEEDA